jgi:hypothetical protein
MPYSKPRNKYLIIRQYKERNEYPFSGCKIFNKCLSQKEVKNIYKKEINFCQSMICFTEIRGKCYRHYFTKYRDAKELLQTLNFNYGSTFIYNIERFKTVKSAIDKGYVLAKHGTYMDDD